MGGTLQERTLDKAGKIEVWLTKNQEDVKPLGTWCFP